MKGARRKKIIECPARHATSWVLCEECVKRYVARWLRSKAKQGDADARMAIEWLIDDWREEHPI
jgi:hypothetical protein